MYSPGGEDPPERDACFIQNCLRSVVLNPKAQFPFLGLKLHAKPKHARGEAGSRSKRGRVVSAIITSWFAIALDEIRTRRILREKADCKQSI